MIDFSYCLDATGNLIKLSLSLNQDALIPGAVELATTAHELSHPLPWTKTIAQAIADIRFVPRPHVAGTNAQSVHETKQLSRSIYPYVEPSEHCPPKADVIELADIYDQLPVDDPGRIEILTALTGLGVQQIPLIRNFTPELHEGRRDTPVQRYVTQGWLSHSQVYKKATVA